MTIPISNSSLVASKYKLKSLGMRRDSEERDYDSVATVAMSWPMGGRIDDLAANCNCVSYFEFLSGCFKMKIKVSPVASK